MQKLDYSWHLQKHIENSSTHYLKMAVETMNLMVLKKLRPFIEKQPDKDWFFFTIF